MQILTFEFYTIKCISRPIKSECSVTLKIPYILWNPKIHYHVTCILNENLFSGSILKNFSRWRSHNAPLYWFEVEGTCLYRMSYVTEAV